MAKTTFVSGRDASLLCLVIISAHRKTPLQTYDWEDPKTMEPIAVRTYQQHLRCSDRGSCPYGGVP